MIGANLDKIVDLMLPLNSPKWAELSHAYGKATDTPNLLQQLYEVPPTEPIPKELSEKLWSSICHQGDAHTASYAAVPHITVIAGERAPADRTMHIALISSIEQGRHLERSPAIPILLAEPYFDALKQCETLVLQCLALKWDEIDYRYLVSALTTFQGFIGLAQMLEIAQATTECPECQAVFVTPGYELLIDPADLSHGTKLFQGHQSNVYIQWLADHPLGFVLVHQTQGDFFDRRLHRNGCTELKEADKQDINPETGSLKLWRVCATDWHKMVDWLRKHALSPWRAIQTCDLCLADLKERVR